MCGRAPHVLNRILTETGLKVRVEMLSSSTTTDFSRCPITSCQNGRKATEQQVNPSWHTWQPRPCWLGPQGSVLRTRPGWMRAQTKPLLSARTQLRSRTGWHTIPDPRMPGLTNGKTNQDCRAPLEKLAARLQANLEEQVYWCQPWTTGCRICLTHQLALPLIPSPPRHVRPDHCTWSCECSHLKCQRHKYSWDLTTWRGR